MEMHSHLVRNIKRTKGSPIDMFIVVEYDRSWLKLSRVLYAFIVSSIPVITHLSSLMKGIAICFQGEYPWMLFLSPIITCYCFFQIIVDDTSQTLSEDNTLTDPTDLLYCVLFFISVTNQEVI